MSLGHKILRDTGSGISTRRSTGFESGSLVDSQDGLSQIGRIHLDSLNFVVKYPRPSSPRQKPG